MIPTPSSEVTDATENIPQSEEGEETALQTVKPTS